MVLAISNPTGQSADLMQFADLGFVRSAPSDKQLPIVKDARISWNVTPSSLLAKCIQMCPHLNHHRRCHHAWHGCIIIIIAAFVMIIRLLSVMSDYLLLPFMITIHDHSLSIMLILIL